MWYTARQVKKTICLGIRVCRHRHRGRSLAQHGKHPALACHSQTEGARNLVAQLAGMLLRRHPGLARHSQTGTCLSFTKRGAGGTWSRSWRAYSSRRCTSPSSCSSCLSSTCESLRLRVQGLEVKVPPAPPSSTCVIPWVMSPWLKLKSRGSGRSASSCSSCLSSTCEWLRL